MTQPFIPLFKVAPNPNIGAAVQAVYDTGYIGQGEQCEEMERQFGAIVGTPAPPLLVNSGTSAIDLALHLIGTQPNQNECVISTPITCTATNSPPVWRGLTILWSDVDPLTGNIDPSSVAAILSKGYNVRAIIGVNWGGRQCDYEPLRGFGIPVIEDAAHGPYHDRIDGGDYICWSFQAIKHETMGDGGMLWAPADIVEREGKTLPLIEHGRLLRWYGLDRRSGQDFRCQQNITEVGFKYQANDLLAAVGLSNLPHLGDSVGRCQENAAYYCKWLADLPGIAVPPYDPTCAYWLMTLCVEDRAGFSTYLGERGIATSQVHAANTKHTAFKRASESPVPLPGVDAFDARQVSIPNGAWVSDEQREYIARTVSEWALNRWRRAA